MIAGVNKLTYPGYGGKTDIKLNLWDYGDMVDALQTDRLTSLGVIKFQNLYTINCNAFIMMTLESTIPAIIIAKVLQGPINRAHAGYKITFPLFMTCWLF